MALPCGTTGSLSPTLRPCLTCRSRKSSSPYGPCTLLMILTILEGTFGRLPFHFRRRPPQSNFPPDTVSRVDKTRRLAFHYSQGGIPPAPPPKLALRFQRLPPILYKLYQNSISGYSKAPRGLSVLSRVTCIFTGTIISPSPG